MNKKILLSKLVDISKESFTEATSSQYDELLSNFLETKKKHDTLSRSGSIRLTSDALKALQKEVFYLLRKKGLSAEKANLKAESICNESIEKFKFCTMVQKKKAGQNLEDIMETNKDILRDFIMTQLKLFDGDQSEQDVYNCDQYRHIKDQKVPIVFPAFSDNIFGNLKNRLNIFNIAKTQSNNLDFWNIWDNQLATISNSMGPTNAFEEQIEWTKNGKMWPFPINNEYMFGSEKNVSFVDHIFLHYYWKKQHVPQSKEVEHFIELVLVGLSKNPYMTVEKKRKHIDWFANFFKDAIVQKYNNVL